MFRKNNLIMTFAAGQNLFDSPSFWVFINSFKNVPDTDLVILTNNMSEAIRDRLIDFEIVDVPETESQFLFRDRHLSYYKYLNDHGHKYKYVFSTDCRDVVFQSSPFEWIEEWKTKHRHISGNKSFLDHFVVLISEGFKAQQSGFACIEHMEFERDIPRPFLRDRKDRWVCNGGTILGTPLAMQNFHFLVWMTTLKTIGRCTDQATINWLMNYLDDEETYNISFPQTDNLCLTGEGVKEGVVEPLLKDGNLISPNGKIYAIVHQWDRLDGLREEILAKYSKE